jgi:hypothetical protein
MFGDTFGTRTDYAKGILYSSRRTYLMDGAVTDLGPGWQDGDRVRAPGALLSKRQIKRELMRKQRLIQNQGVSDLRHLAFLEKLQEHSERMNLIKTVLQIRVKENDSSKPKAAMPDNKLGAMDNKNPLAAPLIGEGGKSMVPETLVNRLRNGRANMGAGNRLPPLDPQAEKERAENERLAWEYVPGPGHPYW